MMVGVVGEASVVIVVPQSKGNRYYARMQTLVYVTLIIGTLK